jgi:hypothetical protein
MNPIPNQQTALALGQQPMVNTTPNIDMQALVDEWRLSKSYVEQYTRDFVKLDTIVDGTPLNFNPDVPYVGDTTLAGLVRAIPRNSLQQLPTFAAVVNGTKYNVPALICSYLLKRYVFNEDTFGKGLLSTLQIGAEQALAHGYAPFFTATGLMYNDFGTTMRLLHYTDTAPEPGITDSNESGYHYVVANLTPSRVRKILRAAQGNPSTSWNVDALKRLLDSAPRPKEYSIYETPARQNQAGESAGPAYQIVTRYETGIDGTIVTFSPDMTDLPLRVLESKSRFGYPRVHYLVIDPAALTPFGVSRVRLASPNQNLMNIYYGNIAAMLLLNSKPPLLKRGRFTKPVQLKQGVVWETTDTQASVDVKSMDSGALQTFEQIAQYFAGQIQNVMGGQTMTVNAGSKSSGFSKTAPGVKQAQDYLDVDTNQITKILENFLRQYAVVALDTLICEQEGEDDLIVDDDTKNAINEVSPGAVGDDNTVHMNWADFYAGIKQWSVEVSASISKDELKDKERGDLQDMLVVLGQNAQELGPTAVQKVQEITEMLMKDKAPLAAKAPAPATPPALPTVTPTPAAAPVPTP